MEPPRDVRLDKWLWAVRVYKTRSLAIAACHAGHVKIGGHPVKPARSVHIGEVITAELVDLKRTVKVLGLIERRVSGTVAKEFMEDLTPPEEYAKQKAQHVPAPFFRPKGMGRPTKKDRRQLDQLALE